MPSGSPSPEHSLAASTPFCAFAHFQHLDPAAALRIVWGREAPTYKTCLPNVTLSSGYIQTHNCHSKVLKLFKKKDHRLFDSNSWLLLLGKPTSDEPWMWQDVPPPNIISHFQLKQQPGPVTRFEQFWSSWRASVRFCMSRVQRSSFGKIICSSGYWSLEFCFLWGLSDPSSCFALLGPNRWSFISITSSISPLQFRQHFNFLAAQQLNQTRQWLDSVAIFPV